MSWSLIIISFIVLFGWTYCIPLAEECSRNPTECEEGTACYQNSVWWSACHKKCPIDWGCNDGAILCTKAVNEMKIEVEQLKHEERINGFANAQLCIAEKACAHKRNLDNPSWLDNVLNAFIEPYIKKEGQWNNKIEECRQLTNEWYTIPDAKYTCQELMADYHISHDLQNALNINGCGTEHDWDVIGEEIKSCVDESNLNSLYSFVAAIKVMNNRNNVRAKCIEHRKSLGLQMQFSLIEHPK